MTHKDRDEWLRDIDARQRNIVFPDTLQNEARFWRNLYTGKVKPKPVTWIGLALLGGTLIYVTFFGPFFNVRTNFPDIAFGFIFLGLLVLVFGYLAKRTLRNAKRRPQDHPITRSRNHPM